MKTTNNPVFSPLRLTVCSIRTGGEGAYITLTVRIENGTDSEQKTLTLRTEQYCELKPTKGEIDEDYYEQLESAASLCAAMRAGENLLAFGPNSVKNLTRKLVQRGYANEIADLASRKLQESGLIDEESDLQREVEKCLKKLWGAKRIEAHLRSRGFGTEVLADLPLILEDVDFPEACAQLIRKHFGGLPESPDDLRRMTASLSRYGYTLSEIRSAFRMI